MCRGRFCLNNCPLDFGVIISSHLDTSTWSNLGVKSRPLRLPAVKRAGHCSRDIPPSALPLWVFQALETPASISQPASPSAHGLTHLLGVHLSQEMGERLGVLWVCARKKPQNKMTGVPLSCEHTGWEEGVQRRKLSPPQGGGWVWEPGQSRRPLRTHYCLLPTHSLVRSMEGRSGCFCFTKCFFLLLFYWVFCMLSHFSGVWLFTTLWTIASQAHLSMGFSGQGYWSGLPWPSPDLPDARIKPYLLMSTCLGRQVLYH